MKWELRWHAVFNREIFHLGMPWGNATLGGGEPLTGINLSPMDVSPEPCMKIFSRPLKAIDAGVFTFMAAHNEINGEPHGSHFLLTEVLRDNWKFDGFVVSDWMDVSRLHTSHKVAETPEDAVFQTVYAGMDMNMHDLILVLTSLIL